MNFFLKNLLNGLGYLGIIFDTHFIPIQNEPSLVLVGTNSGNLRLLSARKRHSSG